MFIGIPKEIKNNENRVAITPAGVQILTRAHHQVLIETHAGENSGFYDSEYRKAGAIILNTAEEIWNQSDMIMKVKEPLHEEYQYFREGLILFTYLHLAAEPELTEALKRTKVIAVAYETVKEGKALPLLTPMSEVAGRMAVQIGATYLEKINGGKGIVLSGVPGVKRGKVSIIGGGVVGTNAAKIAVGLGAEVSILDVNPARLRELDDIFGNSVSTILSNEYNLSNEIKSSDLVIGAVLIPGARAPKLVTEEMIKGMSKGSVIVDVAVDQGGIFETIDHVTTHDDPTFEKNDVIHYAVANMPGAVPRTSTIALTNVTIPYALEIANKGIFAAVLENAALKEGLNVCDGEITHEAVAISLNQKYVSV
jgi:alanine dehydrogenase